MMENNMSLADIAAITNRDNANEGWQNNPFIYLVWLFFARMFGGFNGMGGNGEVATQADVQRAFDTNTVVQKLDGITNGLSQGFYAANTGMLNGFNGIQRDLCQGFHAVNNGISENRFAQQQCCCQIERGIDGVNYNNARNTCDITSAIHAEGEATRALINANTVQELRDRLEQRDREIMSRDFQLSQLSQNQTLINAIKPCPIPAYLVAGSPYSSVPINYVAADRPSCGYGCGCAC